MIQPSKVSRADYSRAIYVVAVNVPFEQVLEPEYWSHVAKDMKPGDRIEVYPEDGTYYGELIVRSQARMALKVAPIRFVEFEAEVSTAGTSEHFIEHRGPDLKWCVIRRSDRQVVGEGHADKSIALRDMSLREQELAR